MARREKVLAVGEPSIPFAVRHYLSPRANAEVELLRHRMLGPLLQVIPRRWRSRSRLRRFYWSQAEVDSISRRAKELAEQLGWGDGSAAENQTPEKG